MAFEVDAYRLSPKARKDLEDIWLYSRERWSTARADSYYADLVRAFVDLATGVRRGRSIDEIKAGYLSLSCGSHYIIHVQRGRKIEIIRILHQRMNIGRHL